MLHGRGLTKNFNKVSRLITLVVLSIAVISSVSVYLTNRYSEITLVWLQKAASPGTGKVYWDSGSGFNDKNCRNFTIPVDTHGRWLKKTMHLPATKLKSLRIVPITDNNTQFEIQQIGFLSDTVQVTWNDGNCWQQQVGIGRIKAEPCPDGSPRIAVTNDFSVTVSDIPAGGMEIRPVERMVYAAGVFFAVFLGGLWLFRPAGSADRHETVLCYAGRAACLVLVCYYLLQFQRIMRYAVDVPYHDEWTYFLRHALPEGFTWQWLFAFHNEHRIPLTKLMAWLNLKLFGLDFALQQFLNFLLYGVIIALMVKLKQRILGDSFRIYPLFLLFLLSPLNYQNHNWGFQSQFHLLVIFTLLVLNFAFDDRDPRKNRWFFSAFVLLAAYSLSVGVALAILFLIAQALFVASGIDRNRQGFLRDFRLLAAPYAIIVIGLVCWFIGYQRPEHHPPLTLPISSAFWEYFLNAISFSLGFTGRSVITGITCLVFVTVPLPLLWLRQESSRKSGRWRITAAIMAILAILAVISMGRAGLGMPNSSRYAEFGLLLIPFAAIAWHMALPQVKLRGCMLAFFWLFCAYTLAANTPDYIYREARVRNLHTLECVEKYYNGIGDGRCLEGFDGSIGAYLDSARALNTKFTRQFAYQ